MSAKVQKSIERAQAQLAKAAEILAAAVAQLGGETAAPVARKTAAKKVVAAVAETPKRGRKAAVAEVPAAPVKRTRKAAVEVVETAPVKRTRKAAEVVAETPKRGRKAAAAEVPAKKSAKAAAAPVKKSKKNDEDFGSF